MQIDRTGTRLDGGNGIFGSVSVPDINKSGLSLLYRNTFSGHIGKLYPSFWKLVYPNDSMDYSASLSVQMAPLVNPIFENLEVCCEYFFVPMTMLDPLWKNFITGKPQPLTLSSRVPQYPLTMGPTNLQSSVQGIWNTYGSLLDFLGYGTPSGDVAVGSSFTDVMASNIRCSAYPWLAYWRVVSDWYTNHNTMDLDHDPSYSGAYPFADNPTNWVNLMAQSGTTAIRNFAPTANQALISQPFVRMYDRDFLSTANLKSGYDNMPKVSIENNAFDLSAFRMASALTKFAERENLTGNIYSDVIFGHFGITPQDSPSRATYLGSFRIPLNVGEVTATAETLGATPDSSVFLGDHAGKASGGGTNHVFNRTFTEHGIVLGITSINVPRALTGFRRADLEYTKGKRSEWMWTELDALGDEPVRVYNVKSEPTAKTATALNTAIIGYNERYWYEKSMQNEVHGQFADPNSQLFSYTACQYFAQGANDLDLYQLNTIDWQNLERRLFNVADEQADPIYFSVVNICNMVRPISAHSTPLV